MDAELKSKKRPNPRQKANIFSAATFCYTIPTFIEGFRKDLEVTDLYETLDEHKSERLGDKLEAAWHAEIIKAKKIGRQPSLFRALVRVFGCEILIYGIVLLICELGVRMLQPLALGQLIAYYEPESNQMSIQEAYIYAGAIILTSFLSILILHPYMMGMLHIGMKMRVACCSLIYRKALKLSKTALGRTNTGQIVNLLSNDVNRFDVAVIFLHQLWIGPLETVIITYLMYLKIGVAAVIGIIFLLMFIPLQFWLGNKTSSYRLRTALRTDERVRLMNEIICGILVIKMYTWEKPFEKLVTWARKREIQSITGTSYIRGMVLSFIMFNSRIAVFASILAYVLHDQAIDAQKVFIITAFYNILRQSMTVFFPQGIAQTAEARISIKRLQEFLCNEEFQQLQQLQALEKSGELEPPSVAPDDPEYAVSVEGACARWDRNSHEDVLTNLSFRLKRGSLVAIIGPVGSGKSSLLHAILKELPLTRGHLQVSGTVSYASQEPWLFGGSVRQNILFSQPMDRIRYRTIVRRCALERDFSLFPYADKTVVGERGVSLSGGQRARINLARAVYKEADIYLLDDPLSAVDTHVGKQLFDDCITGYLKDKSVILITHQLQYLKKVDHIIILEDGQVMAQGTYRQLQESGLDFARMLKEDVEQREEETWSSPGKRLSISRRLSSAHSETSIDSKTVNAPVEVEEQRSTGSVGAYVYKAYFQAGGNCCLIFLMFVLFVVAQLCASAGEYFITYWVNLEQERAHNDSSFQLENNSAFSIIDDMFGNRTAPIADEPSIWDFSQEMCIYIYAGITLATIFFTLIRSFTFFTLCMRASRRLHDKMFASITHATMRFFNTNSSGRILNRFSKDMGAIDELLPSAMIDCLQIGLTLLGIIIVVGIVSPLLLIPTVVVGVFFYFLRIFYLSTSRNVKRLEGITRSPVFAHLNASVQGLTTIRAFKAERVLEKEFDNHQDLHSSAWYSFIASSRAFGYWLDIICVIYIAIVTLSFLALGGEKYGGNVGLAITQAIGLTGMFQWGMRQSAELENQMTSVERVLEYSAVEHERNLESAPERKPRPTWPEHGEIRFVNLSLQYFPQEPPVLKNLNFTILPTEKVGIVGRTGAGKSSLIAALFQLTDTEGAIIIDGVTINDIGLHELRAKIAIIPQEPVLFSGTMRKNLDPFDEYEDEVLWRALEEVELKEAVSELSAGLNSTMSEGGSNFSVGQRQLVCLARAIIRSNRILVLDEATANVDPQTDYLIQETIRKKFADCTVLTIAHRLNTVMDSDKVLVMDAGCLVEYDHPHLLLQDTNGVLYSMLQQTGKSTAEFLSKVAEESYLKKRAESETVN